MKLTKQVLMMTMTMMIGSSAAFADAKDLKVMRELIHIGAQTEPGMSQLHVFIDGECYFSHASKETVCTMTDENANDGKGKQVQLSGKKASTLMSILEDAGAPSDSGMGKFYVGPAAIRCSQVTKNASNLPAAARTHCEYDVSSSEAN
jgi:hypothetical protein